MRYPLENIYVTQKFGNDIINGKPYYSKNFGMKWHDWLDLRARTPIPIYAVCDGTVQVHKVTEWRPYGNFIDLIGGGYLFRYAHLSIFRVKNWQKVKEGDMIGYTGNTGKSGWPHLHFGCYKVDSGGNILNKLNGYFGAIDPEPVLKTKPITMTDFLTILKKEAPEMVDLVSDYSDTSPLTAWNAKALILLLISRANKKSSK